MFNHLTKMVFALMFSFLGIEAHAASAFSITTTDQSSSTTPGGTVIITYTVTNTSGINMPNMRYYPPAGTTRTGGTCGNSLANNASCTVILSFTAPSTPGVIKLGPMKVCGYAGQICAQSNAANTVTVTVTPVSAGILMLGVGFNTDDITPLIAQSTDTGTTWAIKSITGLPANAAFSASSCTGPSSTAVCVAAGVDTSSNVAFVASTIDGGGIWAARSIPDVPSNSTLNSVSCTGTGGSSFCAAAGLISAGEEGNTPIIVQSTGGTTWAVATLTDPPSNGRFFDVSCSGSLCIAVGNNDGTSAPLVMRTGNSGTSWEVISFDPPVAQGNLNKVQCIHSGTLCLTAGVDTASGTGILAYSSDGITWTLGSIPGLPSSIFNQVACSPSASASLCVATGVDTSLGLLTPLLAVSTDGGVNWTLKNISGMSSTHVAASAGSCTGTGANAICAMPFQDTDSASIELVVSKDGGVTWAVTPIVGGPSTGFISSVSCTGNGSTAKCVGAGRNDSAEGLIVTSVDGANTWTVQTVSGMPANAQFGGSGIGN